MRLDVLSPYRWALLLLLVPPLTLLPYATSSTQVARLRNALVFDAAPAAAMQWSPPQQPADFLTERVAPDPYFTEVAQRLALASMADDLQRGLAISRHLLASGPKLTGGAIQGPLRETHRRIVSNGDGYCADFIRAFQAIATAAGMPMRTWAFAFDGFGGHGHIVVEIWNRQAGRWQMLDLFNNIYYPDADGKPLDAAGVREGYARSATAMNSRPLVDGARAGFAREARLREYYLRGIDQWYMWWGNNPFTYEAAASVRWLTPVARPVAQLGAILQGVQPRAVALATDANASMRASMQRLRWHMAVVLVTMLVGFLWLGWIALRRRMSAVVSVTP